MENGTNGKRQFPFVCCKRETETANFRLSAANRTGKKKFILVGRQMIHKWSSTIAVSANLPIYGYKDIRQRVCDLFQLVI
jgi:hypothetical protein